MTRFQGILEHNKLEQQDFSGSESVNVSPIPRASSSVLKSLTPVLSDKGVFNQVNDLSEIIGYAPAHEQSSSVINKQESG